MNVSRKKSRPNNHLQQGPELKTLTEIIAQVEPIYYTSYQIIFGPSPQDTNRTRPNPRYAS